MQNYDVYKEDIKRFNPLIIDNRGYNYVIVKIRIWPELSF